MQVCVLRSGKSVHRAGSEVARKSELDAQISDDPGHMLAAGDVLAGPVASRHLVACGCRQELLVYACMGLM